MRTNTYQTNHRNYPLIILSTPNVCRIVLAGVLLLLMGINSRLSAQSAPSNWTGMSASFAGRITAAVGFSNADMVLFTDGQSMLTYQLNLESSYRQNPPRPSKIDANLAPIGSIDAMLCAPSTLELEAFHFNEYAKLDLVKQQVVRELQVSFFPSRWRNQLDAACYWSANLIFYFRGGEYISYDKKTRQFSAPKSFVSWAGWPAQWRKVDAVANTGRYVYFFNHGQFIVYDQNSRKFLPGYPRQIGRPSSTTRPVAQVSRPVQPQIHTQSARPQQASFSQRDVQNMVETTHLGVGFDAVYIDPQDLTKNSVQNDGFSRPKVFRFVPNPQAFIRMSSLSAHSSQSRNKNLPQGVFGDSHSRFEWSDETRWTRTAAEYQRSFNHAYSGSVGVPGIASVSGSASFQNVKRTTQSSENIYVFQDASYRGHSLEMNLSHTHLLSDRFKQAVRSLGTHSSAYDNFIRTWGTHFSSQAMMGAKCSYRFKLNKTAYEQSSESRRDFEVNVSATIKKVQVDFGTSQGRGRAQSIGSEIGASETRFISYGGSGQTDFGRWSEHATHNRTLVDVKLTSYLSLFNRKYFPNDPQIAQKYQLLNQALQRYFSRHGYRETVNPRKFYELQPREFEIKATVLEVEAAPENHGYYSGKLKVQAFNRSLHSQGSTTILNIEDRDYKVMRPGQHLDLNKSVRVSIQPRDLKGAFACITGELREVTHYKDRRMIEGKTMGNKTARNLSSSEKIRLADLKRGGTMRSLARYTYHAGDRIVVRFEVRRIR